MTVYRRITGTDVAPSSTAPRDAARTGDELTQVGAPDPELRTSPMVDEDEERTLDFEHDASVCYFNGVAYPCGQYVASGTELLHCEVGGVWVRRGDVRPRRH